MHPALLGHRARHDLLCLITDPKEHRLNRVYARHRLLAAQRNLSLPQPSTDRHPEKMRHVANQKIRDEPGPLVVLDSRHAQCALPNPPNLLHLVLAKVEVGLLLLRETPQRSRQHTAGRSKETPPYSSFLDLQIQLISLEVPRLALLDISQNLPGTAEPARGLPSIHPG